MMKTNSPFELIPEEGEVAAAAAAAAATTVTTHSTNHCAQFNSHQIPLPVTSATTTSTTARIMMSQQQQQQGRTDIHNKIMTKIFNTFFTHMFFWKFLYYPKNTQ
jgi:membrane protein insertase Oxa1/YidC/SpoIIIJ